MQKFFVLTTLVSFLTFWNAEAKEPVCQRMVDATIKELGINSEDVKAITDNECDDDNFGVEFEVIKPFKVKGAQVDPKMTISIVNKAISGLWRKDGKPIVVDENVSCLVSTSYSINPNRFCECIIAKPITFDKITLPKGTTVEFTEKMGLKHFRTAVDITVSGKKIPAGNYLIKDGLPIKTDLAESGECVWD